MADIDETTSRHGLGAQLWGAVKGALIDEDPIATTRRAKLQGSRAPADAPATASIAGAASALWKPPVLTTRSYPLRCLLKGQEG